MIQRRVVREPLLRLSMTLGEGCVWDVSKQRLYFVDIDERRVYTYEPASDTIGFEVFEQKITSLGLTNDGTGLLGTSEDRVVYIPDSSLPFPPTSSLKSLRHVKTAGVISHRPEEKRFNDAAVDPAGRLVAGTMGREHHQRVGKLYSLDGNNRLREMMDGLSCSNGMGWSIDGRTMYLTDSWNKEILQFNYETATGICSSRRIFSNIDDLEFGEPDGLCMDSADGIWSARWQAGKVIRLSPDGDIDVIIDFPTAWHITCVVFGGEMLDELYVTTAKTDYNGEIMPERSDGGHLFVVKNLGYTGIERGRFAGKLPN